MILTPKSLLRHPQCVSELAELAAGAFQPVLADPSEPDPATVERVLVCSGKIYYDLVAERDQRGRQDVAILRLEQPYPLPASAFIDKSSVMSRPSNPICFRITRLMTFGESVPGRSLSMAV